MTLIVVKVLPRNALGYYSSGADGEWSLRENRAAFARIKLMPRMLVDVSKRSTQVSIMGGKFKVKMSQRPRQYSY